VRKWTGCLITGAHFLVGGQSAEEEVHGKMMVVTENSRETVPVTERSTLHRKRERGIYDRATIDAILDEGLICHVGFTDGHSTFVMPMNYARVGDSLYFHGAASNRMLRVLGSGAQACVTVTLLDGLVFARASFHHSMNYRSVMLFGTGSRVDDLEEKLAALTAIVEHVAPGRSADARPPTASELRATLVVRVPIREASAKIRSGGPIDDAEDLELDIWAGELPIEFNTGQAIPAEGMSKGVVVPPYVAHYPMRRRTPES